MKILKRISLALVVLLGLGQGPLFSEEIKLSEKETLQAIESTVSMLEQNLSKNADDPDEIGKIALGFVNRLSGLEVNEQAWPMVEDFSGKLRATFDNAIEDENPSESVSDAFEQLDQFLEQGRENFGENESKDENTPESQAGADEDESDDSASDFDYEGFLNNATELLDDVDLPSELPPFLEEITSSILSGNMDSEDKEKVRDFLVGQVNPKIENIGFDEGFSKFSMFKGAYEKVGATWPLEKAGDEDDGDDEGEDEQKREEGSVGKFQRRLDSIENMLSDSKKWPDLKEAVRDFLEHVPEDVAGQEKELSVTFANDKLNKYLLEFGLDQEYYDKLEDLYEKIGAEWPGPSNINIVEGDEDENFDVDEFVSDGKKALIKVDNPGKLKKFSMGLVGLPIGPISDEDKDKLRGFLDEYFSPKLLEIGVDGEAFEALESFYKKIELGWPGGAIKKISGEVEPEDFEDDEEGEEGAEDRIDEIVKNNPIPDDFSASQSAYVENLVNEIKKIFE